MAFISYEQREDFQDDTFKIVATLVADAIYSQVTKDVEKLFSDVDAIYTIMYKRVKNSEEFDKRLEKVRHNLYANDTRDDFKLSSQFDDVRLLWKELAGALDDAGLLLRERIDKNELVTRE